MEQLKQKAGVTPAITTFEGGGDMLLNVLNHTLDMGVGELQEIRPQLDAGHLRLLAVVGEARLPQFPEVATAREQGIDLAVRKFRGLAGPKGLPADVIARWEAAIPKLLDDPAYREVYIANSLQPGFMPHDECTWPSWPRSGRDRSLPAERRRHRVKHRDLVLGGAGLAIGILTTGWRPWFLSAS